MIIRQGDHRRHMEERAFGDIFNSNSPNFDKLQDNEGLWTKIFKFFKFIKNGWGAQGQYGTLQSSCLENGWGAQGQYETLQSSCLENGWGGRIRTHECRDQNPVPYRLATPQSTHNLSQCPNWNLLQDTTKHKFFALLALFFLFSSIISPAQAQSDNTYKSSIQLRNNAGFAINNLGQFKDGILYSSQNEIFYKLEKLQLNNFQNEDFKINNLITHQEDFYLLTSSGVYKNLEKIFGKEECFHLEKVKSKTWISCKSGIYLSKDDKTFQWELDEKSPQGVIFFTLNKSQTKPQYAASSQFGFYRYEKKQWFKHSLGLKRGPEGDFNFGRFVVTEIEDQEHIFLPSVYGIAVSDNEGKDFFLVSEGIKKDHGLLKARALEIYNNELFLISSTGAYRSKLQLIPQWQKINIEGLRKAQNNFENFTAIAKTPLSLLLATSQGEIIELKQSTPELSTMAYYDTKAIIEDLLELEPQISEVHNKSLEFAGIPTGKNYKSYIKKAKLRNLAPRLESYLERDNEDLVFIETNGSDDLDDGSFATSFDQTNQNRNNSSVNAGLRLSWDLGKVIYDDEIIDINNSARLTANIRENLLTEVTQLYFKRKHTLADTLAWYLDQSKLKSTSELIQAKLKLQESIAQLDARTGAWYSQALNKKLFKLDHKDPLTLKAMELYRDVKIN